jgi:hypothetical protein
MRTSFPCWFRYTDFTETFLNPSSCSTSVTVSSQDHFPGDVVEVTANLGPDGGGEQSMNHQSPLVIPFHVVSTLVSRQFGELKRFFFRKRSLPGENVPYFQVQIEHLRVPTGRLMRKLYHGEARQCGLLAVRVADFRCRCCRRL